MKMNPHLRLLAMVILAGGLVVPARAQDAKPADPADDAAKPAGSRPSTDFDPASEQMRFLNLGVKKSYIGAESGRLIDQLHTMIPPLYEPAFMPFNGYTLPKGAFRIAFNADQFTNHHDFGRDKHYALFFDNIKVENLVTNLDAMYGLDEDTTLRLTVPFKSINISGDGKAFRILPMVMTMNGGGSGLGDVQLLVKRKWFDQFSMPFNLATVVGVQFPTGKHDVRFNEAQNLTANGMPMPFAGGMKVNLFSDDLRIPNSAQPGTGSWGLTLGVMGTRQLTWNHLRGAFHAGVLFKGMKDNHEGVNPGNELIFGTSYVSPLTGSDHVSFEFSLLSRKKQADRYPGLITHPEADPNGMPIMDMATGMLVMFTTPRPDFQNGTVTFFSPTVVFLPKPSTRIFLSPVFRVREPYQGPSPSFRLLVGISSTF